MSLGRHAQPAEVGIGLCLNWSDAHPGNRVVKRHGPAALAMHALCTLERCSR